MERALLVGLISHGSRKGLHQESLEELEELARSAGATPVGVFLQERPKADPAYLIGSGKVEEIAHSVEAEEIDLVIFDEDLSPVQLRNLEGEFGVKVIDRSELILDIFAQRARSAEGKRQVELAQLEYLLPRLSGKGTALSRLGGGIGTRGPGETKLEVDRRRIRTRIARIKRDLSGLRMQRALHRSKRQGVPIPTMSLVGYTNAGKSTLFNSLTQSETTTSPRMFATLDPLVRRLSLPGGQEVLLSDTVGFIRKLPHTLVAAFHATLEEALEADLLLHVVDAAHDNSEALRRSVYEVLEQIGYRNKPLLEVYNKIDLLGGIPQVSTSREHVFVSAIEGTGLGALLSIAEGILNRGSRKVRLLIPYQRSDVLSRLHSRVRVDDQEYRDDGVLVTALLPQAELSRYREYLEWPEDPVWGDDPAALGEPLKSRS